MTRARAHGGGTQAAGGGVVLAQTGNTSRDSVVPNPVPSSPPWLPRRASPRLYHPPHSTHCPSASIDGKGRACDFCCFGEHALLTTTPLHLRHPPKRHTPVHRSPPDHIIIPPASPFPHISLLTYLSSQLSSSHISQLVFWLCLDL